MRTTHSVLVLVLGVIACAENRRAREAASPPTRTSGTQPASAYCPNRPPAAKMWRLVAFDRRDGTIWDLESPSSGGPAVLRQYYQYSARPGSRTLDATWEVVGEDVNVTIGGAGELAGAHLEAHLGPGSRAGLGSVVIRDRVVGEEASSEYRRPLVVFLDSEGSFWDRLEAARDCTLGFAQKPRPLHSDQAHGVTSRRDLGSENSQRDAIPAGLLDEVNDDTSQPITRSSVRGNWVGIGADGSLLVSANVDANVLDLSLVEMGAEGFSASAFRSEDFVVTTGKLSAGGPSAPVAMSCDATRGWGAGWGTCDIRVDGKRGQREVFLFLLREQPWLAHVLMLRSRGQATSGRTN
jgi:hypothetical protein